MSRRALLRVGLAAPLALLLGGCTRSDVPETPVAEDAEARSPRSPASASAPSPSTPSQAAAPELRPSQESDGGGTWTEVARWRDQPFRVTEAFTVTRPWRVRWRLENPEDVFLLMVAREGGEWSDVLAARPGTTGAFEAREPGTYELMVHTSARYEVIVEERAD